MVLREWLSMANKRLKEAGIDTSKLESQLLAAHVLRVDRSWLLANPEHDFNELAGEQLLQRRESGEPLAYILGVREFYGRPFGVDPSVLIPRQDTELLVEAALKHGPTTIHSNGKPNPLPEPVAPENRPWAILDIGTGSGALAITLKLERLCWDVTAVDVSAEALATAAANAIFLGARVRFLLSDGFEAVLGESFDMIVTNPPYIANGEELPDEVVRFEPPLALFAGDEGLEFYRRLALEAHGYLTEGGTLLTEVGHTQSGVVKELFEAANWTHIETLKDLAKIERVLVFQYDFTYPADELSF